MKRIPYILMAALLFAACTQDPEDTVPTAPGIPTNLKLHSATETGLTFQWSAVAGATGYDWKLLQGGSQVQNGSCTNRNTSVGDLTPGTTYQFAVRAKNDAGASVWSDAIDATTEGGGEEPGLDDPGNQTPVTQETYESFGIPAIEDEDLEARAFPGADGGGMWAKGGRGGKVYHVTSLEDNGSKEGTLRYAVEKGERPIIVVFDVAGVIPLTKQLNITKGQITIAGQSAPGDGICLKNYTFRISASDVVVRFIRCRMGDELKTEDDAIQVMSHDDDKYAGIVIDHCSVSWSTDECASFYGMKDFTFSWNIVSESLRESVHGKGTHGYGGIWGGSNATYHHNLLAHHDSRNPRIDHDYVSTQKGPLTIANNVVYNWKGNTCYGGESINNTSTYRKYNFVGNYYKPGPATSNKWLLDATTSCSNCSGIGNLPAGSVIVPGRFYMTGNTLDTKSSVTSDNWTGLRNNSIASKIKSDNPFPANAFVLQSADDAFNAVLKYAGASYERDRIDARIADEVRSGTATYKGSKTGVKGLIDTQTDVQEAWWKDGFPVYSFSSDDEKLRDSDSDGMPNWFEDAFGLDKGKNDAAGFNLDFHKRYTNIEMYLHYLVKDIVAGGNENGTYTLYQ